MNLLQCAGKFAESLLKPGDPRQCPRCGYRMTKRHDTYHRVVLQLERSVDTSEAYLAGRFRIWLANWGIPWQSVQVLVTDGASGYYRMLNLALRRTWQQRCLFHLWRNLLPDLRRYAAEAGPAAGILKTPCPAGHPYPTSIACCEPRADAAWPIHPSPIPATPNVTVCSFYISCQKVASVL